MNCPNCSKPNPDDARFCYNCGFPLEPARRAPGERKLITVLFADVVGSTAMAEQLDPEEVAEIMNGAFGFMNAAISQYGGTVGRLMGDAVLAFFGAPQTHEDDADRAVRAALQIQAAANAYANVVRQRFGTRLAAPFAVRVGINSGLAVLDLVGDQIRTEYTAMGDVTNVAARMQSLANPGAVLISADTYKLVRNSFHFISCGFMDVRGKSAPVATYEVLAGREKPGQARGLEGLHSPLVGREAELHSLHDGLKRLLEGQGGLVAVTGEAGLGKSRLIAELRELAENANDVGSTFADADLHKDAETSSQGVETTPLLWLEGRCISYAQMDSYFPWRQIIRGSIGATETDSPAEVRARLSQACQRCALPADNLPYIEALLGVVSEDSLQASRAYESESRFGGELMGRRITEAVRGYICALALSTPTVLVFDDLHWADDASLALLLNVIDVVKDFPLLFLCLLRPDREASSWSFLEQAQTQLGDRQAVVALEPLAEDATHELLANLLYVTALPEPVSHLILDKSEGNPFFVEEVIRSLIDLGYIVQENGHWRAAREVASVMIPSTLAGVLSARIDRLPDETKLVAQSAAVIGRVFGQRVLDRVCQAAPAAERVAAVDNHLATLIHQELVRRRPLEAETEYIFKHALTQEAAYQTILIKRRRDLHGRAGEAIEALFSERLPELAAVLAYHFGEAQQHEAALKYSILAGDAAYRIYALAEAGQHYSHAIDIAKMRAELVMSEIVTLFLRRGRALELQSKFQEALANYQEMEMLARERGQPEMELAALVARASLHAAPSDLFDPEQAEQLSLQALAQAIALQDVAAQAKIYWNLMLLRLFGSDMREAVQFGEQSLAIARAHNLQEQLAYTLHDISRAYVSDGNFERSVAALAEAQELWRQFGDRAMLADNLATMALFRMLTGEFQTAIALSDEAYQISQTIGNIWGQSYSLYAVGFIYVARGEIGKAIDTMETCIRLGEQAGFIVPAVDAGATLAMTYAELGDVAHAQEWSERVIANAETRLPDMVHNAAITRARVKLLIGDVDGAEAIMANIPTELLPNSASSFLVEEVRSRIALIRNDYVRALVIAETMMEALKSLHIVLMSPGFWLLKGRALLGLGQKAEAQQAWEQGRAIEEQIGGRFTLWQLLAALADLEAGKGHSEAAASLRAQSRELVAFIAEHIGSTELRDFFLGLPEVRALIES